METIGKVLSSEIGVECHLYPKNLPFHGSLFLDSVYSSLKQRAF